MKLTSLAVGVALAFSAIAAHADFSNPGFESGTFSSWSAGGDAVSVVGSTTVFGINVAPVAGNYMAQLGSGFFGLAIQATEETTQPVDFYYRLIAGANESADLAVNYASLSSASPTQIDYLSASGIGIYDSGWKRFTAPVGSTAIEFYQSSTFGNAVVFIDAAPVPEPESYAMLLAGLSVMGAIARRRKLAKQA